VNVHVIRSESSLDHEGSPDIVSVWLDEDDANEECERLQAVNDAGESNDMWAKWTTFSVEKWEVQ
jgi:hypothetical protein